MKKWIGLIVVLVLAAAQAWALEEFKPLATLQDAAVATGNGTALDVALYNSVGLEVTIATTATVTFEGTVDGSTWASTVCTATSNTSATLVTSATATGTYQCGVAGLSKFRARISSWTSGAVTVKARATTALISRRGGASGGGLASTDIDTCAEMAALWTDETGTCGGPVLSQGPTLADVVVTGSLNVPNGASPTTDAFGEVAGDNNAWAAGRGALQFYDGTANTYIIGALVSDAPANGECIKWNTGGTITWETCGSGSMATDTLWDVAGDLAYGTGSNTGGRLAIGTAGQVLGVNAGATAPEWKSTLTALTSISFGADPGDGSPLNLSNNTCINWEIATPGTDKCLKVNASDQLDFNGTINLTGAATGSLRVNGVTSGSLSITTADATAQAITVTGAAQTTGATSLTIPDMVGTNDTFLFAAKAATLTGKTYDTEGTGNSFTYKLYKWIPGAGCNNATAGTIWDLPTSNPAVAACRTGTNTTKGVLEFADGANALTAQLTEYLNEDWTGAIDATIIYEADSTSTNNTVWQLAIACAGDGESDDPAFTDDVFTADAGKATAHQYNATAANTITTTGTCAAGEIMHIRLKRDPAHASDTLAATAKFVGLSLKMREAQ